MKIGNANSSDWKIPELTADTVLEISKDVKDSWYIQLPANATVCVNVALAKLVVATKKFETSQMNKLVKGTKIVFSSYVLNVEAIESK